MSFLDADFHDSHDEDDFGCNFFGGVEKKNYICGSPQNHFTACH